MTPAEVRAHVVAIFDNASAGIITAIVVSIAAVIVGVIKLRLKRPPPKLEVVHRASAYDTRAGIYFPLKYYVEMRNDSTTSVEVTVVTFEPNKISVKLIPPAVLQVYFNDRWHPDDGSVEKVAIYPGQRCRAWIAADEDRFNLQQLDAAAGQIGRLIVSADKTRIPIDL